MNEGTAIALVVISSLTLVVSAGTLVGGIYIGIRAQKKLAELEKKYDDVKSSTKRFAQSVVDAL